MSLNTGAAGQGEGSTTHYGHADYKRDKAAGMSDYDIKKLIDADPSKMGNGGVTGDLYKQISAGSKPPSSGNSGGNYGPGSGGGGQQPMAGSQDFQNRLDDAVNSYKPEKPNMDDFKYGDGGEHDHLGKDFNDQVQKEQLIKETDPFGDSWNSADFFGKHISMAREAAEGRGDVSGITNKYIFNANQTNPVDIAALDKQIRTAPMYSNAKSELAKLHLYGDSYSQGPANWTPPSSQSPYEPPDFDGIYDKTTSDIDKMKIN
jgi:hypothetical protein